MRFERRVREGLTNVEDVGDGIAVAVCPEEEEEEFRGGAGRTVAVEEAEEAEEMEAVSSEYLAWI